MPASTRRALGAVVAATGIVLLVLGAWLVVKLGPSGEAQFGATSASPGAIVVPSNVLNAVDVPVRVTAIRGDGGPVRLTVAPSTDVRAVLGTAAVCTVNALHYPGGTLDLHTSGSGTLRDISTADVWRLAAKGAGSTELVVDQGRTQNSGNSSTGRSTSTSTAGTDRGPEMAVVTSGDTTALKDVTVTLTWADRAWFFEALAVAMAGAVIAAFALNYLWQSRVTALRREGSEAAVAGPAR